MQAPDVLGQPAAVMPPAWTQVYATLAEVARQRGSVGRQPPDLVVFTDIGKDYDDLAALTLLAELHRLNLVRLRAVVANLHPATDRARLARGALDTLRLAAVPVAVGSRGAARDHAVLPYEFDCAFMAPRGYEAVAAPTLLQDVLDRAQQPGKSVSLVCLSSLTDVWTLAKAEPGRLAASVAAVHLQGGNAVDASGRLRPETTAANNVFDPEAAASFHAWLQDAGVPSFTYTRDAAFATQFPSAQFASLAATGHPIGLHLRQVQVLQEQCFYAQACQADPALRFRPGFDQAWYLEKKTTWRPDQGLPPPSVENLAPYLAHAVLYDALAALGAAGEDVTAALGVYRPAARALAAADGRAVCHAIVGAAGAAGGGVDAPALRTVLAALLHGALLATRESAGASDGVGNKAKGPSVAYLRRGS